LVSSYPQKSVRRRSATFITYQIQQPSESERFFTDTRINPNQRQLCQECLRRENLLQNEHQRLLRIQKENRQLSEQLHLSVLLNDQYQEEIIRLKQHLTKLSIHLQEYQMNFQLLQEKILPEKPTKSKQDIDIDQLKRLRLELHVYNQVIANKRNEEQKQINYFSQK
jgi:hypothetical protein